jgi:hypothetical protein
LLLIAAVVIHLARAKDSSAFAATNAAPTPSAPAAPPSNPVTAAPVAAPAPPSAEPQSGTLSLQRPAAAGHVWLDGQKLNAGSATVVCGKHQVKVGAHGRAHAVDVPCGGEVHVSR